MINFVSLIDGEFKIEENLEKIRQKKCNSHNKYKASYFCINPSCVKNSTSFLCELCYNNHSKNHAQCQEIKFIDDLFSTKRFSQIIEDYQKNSSDRDEIDTILQDLDQIFGKLKGDISNIIDEECKKSKDHIKNNYSIDSQYIMKIFKQHEQILLDLFIKDEIMNNFNLTINPYLESFSKVFEAFREQIEIIENHDKKIKLFLQNFSENFAKINQEHKNIIDFVQKKISILDESFDNLKLKDQMQSAKLDENLLQKLQTGIIKIDKKISRLHTGTIWKIIDYKNSTKYITCSADKTIIIRNSEDNVIIKTLTEHKEAVREILILSNGKLASSSVDKTIKIWNLDDGNCEQTLIGHSDWVCCLLELPNSVILSGSQDSTIGVWDISQIDRKELQFYHQVKNDKQSWVSCMMLIDSNELAVSSYKDINIYSFDNIAKKSFYIIKVLKGHTDWILDIKLMKNSKDLLVSCSGDKHCRLWSIRQNDCLKIFKGHSNWIQSMQILSEKIFVSASSEIIFWNIYGNEFIHCIKQDHTKNLIFALVKNDINELICAGGHDFIGFIKI